MAWLPVERMPLGGALWTLIVLALIGVFLLISINGWLLFLWVVQHVRIV